MTPQQRDAVCTEAKTWIGTPYHHHGRIKGVGVDCGQLLVGVFHNAGLVPNVDLGAYATDWHLHHSEELYLGWMRKFCRPILREDAQPGDIEVFRFGRTYSHGTVIVQGNLRVHAYVNRAVILSAPYEEPLEGRLSQFWTLK